MKRLILILMGFCPVFVYPQQVQLQVALNWVDIPVEQTQTELKKGWKIVDIQLSDRKIHYLWGIHSKQLTDDAKPRFTITPGTDETLADYAIIRLKGMRKYRQLARPLLVNNDYYRIDLNGFDIKAKGDLSFIVQPHDPLPKGDYILVNLVQKPIGELGDYQVYSFQIP